jgi:putative endonuclease
MEATHYSYILASKRNGALYVGATPDLAGCVLDHKCNMLPFTALYLIHRLVYFQRHVDADAANRHVDWIKQLHRIWKLDLIETCNPEWHDLYDDISSARATPSLDCESI